MRTSYSRPWQKLGSVAFIFFFEIECCTSAPAGRQHPISTCVPINEGVHSNHVVQPQVSVNPCKGGANTQTLIQKPAQSECWAKDDGPEQGNNRAEQTIAVWGAMGPLQRRGPGPRPRPNVQSSARKDMRQGSESCSLNDFSPWRSFGTKRTRRGHPRQAIFTLLERMIFYQIPVTRTTSHRLYCC
jgi:hypothetical protein